MADPLLYVAISVIVLVLLGLILFLKKSQTKDGAEEEGEAENGAAVARRPVEPQMAGGMRRRQRAGRMQRREQDSDEEGEEEFEHVTLPDGKVGAKKMKKLQEKEEKKRMREAELQEREERKERDKKMEELRKKDEAVQAEEEKLREEEEKLRKEEEEKREHEEYLKLKEQFSVEEEGQEAISAEESESLLHKFITYITDMKVVMLEDLAAHFKLRTQDVIARIRDLQDEGRLSGVIDDRGKFIHITQAEYEAVAKFMRQRGRVSISDLVESSNELINLSPDNAEIHRHIITSS